MSLIQPGLMFLQTGTMLFHDAAALTFRALRKKIAAANERSKTRRALHGLNDYMLKDMGISRCDIDRIASRTHAPRQ